MCGRPTGHNAPFHHPSHRRYHLMPTYRTPSSETTDSVSFRCDAPSLWHVIVPDLWRLRLGKCAPGIHPYSFQRPIQGIYIYPVEVTFCHTGFPAMVRKVYAWGSTDPLPPALHFKVLYYFGKTCTCRQTRTHLISNPCIGSYTTYHCASDHIGNQNVSSTFIYFILKHIPMVWIASEIKNGIAQW